MIKKKCAYCGKLLIVRLNKIKYHPHCYYNSLKGSGNPFYGKKHLKSSKYKMSKAQIGNKYALGIKRSLETRKKLSELAKNRTGDKNPFFGKKHTKKTIEKISLSRQGKCMGSKNPSKRSEVREKIKQKMLGRKITWGNKISKTKFIKFKEGDLVIWSKGKKFSEKHKQNISKIRIEKGLAKLEKNPMWQGGVSYEPYPLNWTNQLREEIRNKYHNKCSLCGSKESSIDKRKEKMRKLPIHHINYIKEDVREINLIPLCTKCHAKVNTNRDFWFAFFCEKKRLKPNDLISI